MSPAVFLDRSCAIVPARGTRLKTFRDAIRTEDFVVTATLPLRPSTTREHIESYADQLKALVNGLQVGDNWQAEGHMDVLAAAGILLNRGVDPVVHLCCRDRNRVALQGCLLGAAALGVSSLLLSHGQKLPERFRGKVKGVFDTQPAQLFSLAQQFDSDSDGATDSQFLIGTPVPVIKPQEDWQAAQIHQRIESGVRFIQTRPCLNMTMLRSYMQGIVGLKLPHRAAFIVELPVLTSVQAAQVIKDSHPGVRIPGKLLRQVAESNDPLATGVSIAADALAQMTSIPGVSGVNILCDGEPGIVVDVVNAAGIRR